MSVTRTPGNRLLINKEANMAAYKVRHNNASVRSVCPVCKGVFKPRIGDVLFLGFDPVCDDCDKAVGAGCGEERSHMDVKFRTMSYGDASYFRSTKADAEEAAQQVMARNGCGCIEQRQPSGLWKVISRFEPSYGIVAA